MKNDISFNELQEATNILCKEAYFRVGPVSRDEAVTEIIEDGILMIIAAAILADIHDICLWRLVAEEFNKGAEFHKATVRLDTEGGGPPIDVGDLTDALVMQYLSERYPGKSVQILTFDEDEVYNDESYRI